jgi:hypothetical protein
MWIWTLPMSRDLSSATIDSYAFRRAFGLACRADGLSRTHSSSRAIVRLRAESWRSSAASRFSFCSSQDE